MNTRPPSFFSFLFPSRSDGHTEKNGGDFTPTFEDFLIFLLLLLIICRSSQIMKIIVFVLFCVIISVQSKITPLYTPLLIYEGKSVTLKCNDTSWSWNGDLITDCKGCPSNCKIEDRFKRRVEAACENNETFLRFISTKFTDEGTLKCPESDTASFSFLVGRNGPSFNPGNGKSYALNNQDYTLTCEGVVDMIWFNQTGEHIGYFSECQNYMKNKYTKHFSCSYNNNKYNTILNLKKVTVEKDDGKIFGCKNLYGFFLFTLKVNVAVESVSIQAEKQYFIEKEFGTFQCIVEKSKPKPSFQWEYVLKSGTIMNIPNAFDKHELMNGKLWKTTSTIKLKLTRELSEIRCSAHIEDMPYVIKTYKPKILYAPEGSPIITSTPSQICIGGKMQVTCEWKGGDSEADVELSCLSEIKTGKSNVTIEKTVSSRLDKTCICKGKHVAKNTETQKILDIQYPPSSVSITQSKYLEGEKAEIICLPFDGNPPIYNYLWSPSSYNFLTVQNISIKLNRTLNGKKLNCSVHHKCMENNPVSGTLLLNVEYKPEIKIPNTFTVVENKENTLNCLSDGNPKPTTKWEYITKNGTRINASNPLNISFNRNNTGHLTCIATAISSENKTLKSSKKVSIDVTYPPEIRIDQNVAYLGQNSAAIKCVITSHPESKEYGMNQTWGNINKVHIPSKEKNFKDVSYGDLGRWTCWAKNGVGKKTEKFVDIKVNVSPRFICNKNQSAITGSLKKIKCCFYCHPEAFSVKWYNKNKEMPADNITYVAAEDGLFPFTGNCSILEVKVESNLQDYQLEVKNSVGKKTYTVSLYSDVKDNSKIYIIVSCVIVILVIIILVAAFFLYRRSAKNKQNKNNLVTKDKEEESGTGVEPLYAQVNKPPKKLNKDYSAYDGVYASVHNLKNAQPQNNNANIENLYAKVDKSQKSQPKDKDKNGTGVEPLYAQVNKPPKNLNKTNYTNVEDLYAKVDKSQKSQPKEKNEIENNSLYANLQTINQDKNLKEKPQPVLPSKPKLAKKKPPPVLPQKPKFVNEPKEDLYENLEMKPQQPDGKELLYADLEFLSKSENKENPKNLKTEDQTLYASINFDA